MFDSQKLIYSIDLFKTFDQKRIWSTSPLSFNLSFKVAKLIPKQDLSFWFAKPLSLLWRGLWQNLKFTEKFVDLRSVKCKCDSSQTRP